MLNSQIHHPSTEWTSLRRNQVEDDATRHTTPMYRPPEILDLYQNFVIGLPIDLWACLMRFTSLIIAHYSISTIARVQRSFYLGYNICELLN